LLQCSTFLATIKYFFDRGIRYITLAHGLSNHISDSSYQAEHGPYPFVSIEDVLDHFDHVIDLVGIDHVGIGSDFDGVGDSLPTGLKDVTDYPNLIEGLLRCRLSAGG